MYNRYLKVYLVRDNKRISGLVDNTIYCFQVIHNILLSDNSDILLYNMSNQETTKKLKLEVNNVNYNQLDELRTDEIDIALGASNNLQELNKRVLWKTDLHILPLITLAYLLNYLDRTNLGNSRTLNNDIEGGTMGEQIGLSSDRYNIIVCLFYVPYVLFEFPSNILMKKFTPSVHLSRIITLWGAITICTAAVNNYAGMIAIRIAMGIAEVCYPSSERSLLTCLSGRFLPRLYLLLRLLVSERNPNLHTTERNRYKPSERATRMAIFASFTSLSGAFSGLIATGCSYLNGKGGIPGWKYLFILEGIPTIIIGVSIYFFLPDYPETAKFFTSEERAACLQRCATTWCFLCPTLINLQAWR